MKKYKLKNKSLSISTQDTICTDDNLSTFKPWFNGMKHFYKVKVLPKRNDVVEK